MTYRFAAIVLLILSSSATADSPDTSYADEDWFPIDDQHYMAVAATADTDMVLHMRTESSDPSSQAEAVVALRNDARCQTLPETELQVWTADGELQLNQKTVQAESRCEGHSRVYRPNRSEDTEYLNALIASDQPITVQIDGVHGRFDNINGREAWEDLHTLPDSSQEIPQPYEENSMAPSSTPID